MSVIFFVNAQPTGVHIQLPSPVAGHVMTALAYELDEVADTMQLLPQDLIARISTLRRQLVLGHGREFTGEDVNEEQLLGFCDEMERLAEQARLLGTAITLL